LVDYTDKLISESKKALKSSYSPYSGIKVGVALLCKNGIIYKAGNIECASFSLTICAERVAFSKAISDNIRQFHAIAISSNTDKYFYPCGACLQFMSEFSNNLEIILIKSKKEYIKYNINELLPLKFKL